MTESYALGTRAARFGLVGLSGTVVNLGVLYLCHGLLGWPTPIGVLLATEIAIVHNFVWNDRWTFGRRHASLERLARFNLSSLGGALLCVAITSVLAAGGAPYLLADLVGVATSATCNFAASTRWTWKDD